MKTFEKDQMTTLSSCTNILFTRGFTENFMVGEGGLVAPSSNKIYIPAEVKIVNYYRFEGESDPGDNAILYSIETNDGTKGLLIDSYAGPYIDRKISKFIKEVERVTKKAHTPVGPHSSIINPKKIMNAKIKDQKK